MIVFVDKDGRTVAADTLLLGPDVNWTDLGDGLIQLGVSDAAVTADLVLFTTVEKIVNRTVTDVRVTDSVTHERTRQLTRVTDRVTNNYHRSVTKIVPEATRLLTVTAYKMTDEVTRTGNRTVTKVSYGVTRERLSTVTRVSYGVTREYTVSIPEEHVVRSYDVTREATAFTTYDVTSERERTRERTVTFEVTNEIDVTVMICNPPPCVE